MNLIKLCLWIFQHTAQLIFTESGDLVKTIDHDSGSGDEIWGGNILDLQTVSDSGQLLVSGIYIAHITDNESGGTAVTKFVIIR